MTYPTEPYDANGKPDRIVLERRLHEAEQALHQLTIGKKPVSVDYDGRKTAFNQTSRAALVSYVERLRRDLGMPPRTRRRAIRPIF